MPGRLRRSRSLNEPTAPAPRSFGRGEIPPDLRIQDVDEALDCQRPAVNVLYFDEGGEIRYHAHADLEELFYVLDGEFSLKLGRSGEAEYVEDDEGTFWVASQLICHDHCCLSDGGGAVLVVGAPPVEDRVSIRTRSLTTTSTMRWENSCRCGQSGGSDPLSISVISLDDRPRNGRLVGFGEADRRSVAVDIDDRTETNDRSHFTAR